MAGGPEALDGIVDVSRETLDRLKLYAGLVGRWQKAQNLVAPSTLGDIWRRHIADSAQLAPLFPAAQSWLDLGSGAGFPGLVIAICLADRKNFCLHLVESNSRKVAFLRAVIRETGISAQVHDSRIESFSWPEYGSPDVISARALASLTELCGLAAPFMSEKTVAIFHKGWEYEAEIKSALHDWNLDLVVRKSVVDAGGRLIEIRALEGIGTA